MMVKMALASTNWLCSLAFSIPVRVEFFPAEVSNAIRRCSKARKNLHVPGSDRHC